MANSAAVAALRERTPGMRVLADSAQFSSYTRDQSVGTEWSEPLAVAMPRSTEEVVTCMQWANDSQVPVVTRGAGSGLAGGANASAGCLVLSTQEMRQSCHIDPENQTASVRPGVTNRHIDDAAREVGLWYPPDPASRDFSTIGGNIATNAGGLCCVSYGVTRDYVLGLEVVLADGRLIYTGSRVRKNVAGYDITGLFVGSEGTLGVVTRADLRLIPAPAESAVAVFIFSSLETATSMGLSSLSAGVRLSLLEVMDNHTIRAVEALTNMGLDTTADAIVFAQTTGPTASAEASVLADLARASGATYVATSTDPFEGQSLLDARRMAHPALERLGSVMLDDVSVPLSEVPRLIRDVQAIAAARQVTIATFGHLGDGNMHPSIVFDPSQPEEVRRCQAAFRDIVESALEHGGSCTGEHGVGLLKRPFLRRQLGSATLDVHRRIKDALDPTDLLNPGKAIVSS